MSRCREIMKLPAVLFFSTLLLGSECFDLKGLSSALFQETVESINNFLAPLREAQDEISGVYERVKTNYHKTGIMIRSPDDCLKLTNTTELAYSLAVNVTDFVVAATKELGNSMNSLINCSTELLVLNCVIDKLKGIRSQVIELQTEFNPYLSEGISIYGDIVNEFEECVGIKS